jgi:hypothetical protein
MLLEEHKKVLGQYSKSKYNIIHWTNYTPPLWEKGMLPDEAGVVNKRYITIDDRSKPNSMGIYYRLFEHPILALPVIYHEFLHYGGTKGIPSEGIENETEVHIREILFMKFLIAELAPTDYHKIPDYEQSIIDMIEDIELSTLGSQIIANINQDFDFKSMSDYIENIYGKPLEEPEVENAIQSSINLHNFLIGLDNKRNEMKNNWFPDIEWPDLTSEENENLLIICKDILYHQYTSNNRVDKEQWNRIFQDEVCQKYLSSWNSYIHMKKSLNKFQEKWDKKYRSAEKTTASICDRYSVWESLNVEIPPEDLPEEAPLKDFTMLYSINQENNKSQK